MIVHKVKNRLFLKFAIIIFFCITQIMCCCPGAPLLRHLLRTRENLARVGAEQLDFDCIAQIGAITRPNCCAWLMKMQSEPQTTLSLPASATRCSSSPLLAWLKASSR